MSQRGVTEAIGSLVCDPTFKTHFKENPDASLAGFDLTEEERAVLKKQLHGKDVGTMSANDIAGALGGTGSGSNITVARRLR